MIFYLDFNGSIRDTASVLKVLPPGYLLGKLIDGTHYEISFNERGRENPVVGRCQVDQSSGQLLVVVCMNGQYSMNFLSEIVRMHGTVSLHDPATLDASLKDELLWLVVYPWRDSWAYSAKPAAEKAGAFADGIPAIAMKTGKCMLVAFTVGQWPTNSLRYERSFLIKPIEGGEVTVGHDDLGGGEIEFTTFERL